MKQKIKLGERFATTFKRFRVAYIFLVILVSMALALFPDKSSREILPQVIWYCFTAAFLSVAMKLLREEKPGVAAEIVLQAALLGFWVYCYFFENFNGACQIAMGSISVLVFIACFINSFYKDRNDVPLVNFTIRIVVVLAATGIVTLILMLAIFLIMGALNMLFKINVTNYAYFMAAVVSWALLFPTMLLQFVPEGQEKHDYSTNLGKFVKGVTKWLFLPVTAAYLAILYVYAIKILVTWTLPNGWVANPVTVSFALCLLLIFLLYPEAHSENEKPLSVAVRRWIPVAMLPLLALMSVGIFKRTGDYGATIERLYVLALNLWCYGVCLGLIFSHGKRLWWIPASFALVFLLTSVGPWNFTSTTKRIIQKDARNIMMANGITKFPADSSTYSSLISKADSTTKERLIDKLAYLEYNYRKDTAAIRDLVDYKVDIYGIYPSYDADSVVSLPDTASFKDVRIEQKKDSVIFRIPHPMYYRDTLLLAVPKEELKKLYEAVQ
ncbi:MAG: DUF4153 domain-containing protein [Bacteroidales bacterium]|nr:DUF4153 domain-containing protein [Bacteroidales bacterium]MDY6000588.1 DUF4153 domain-containing protein [Candidatus Cryptobacteroides sp.]